MPCSYGSEVKPGQSGNDLVLIQYQDFGINNFPEPSDLLPFGLQPNSSGGYDVNTTELFAPENVSLYGTFYSDIKSNFCASPPPTVFPGAVQPLNDYLAVVAQYKWNEFCQCSAPTCAIFGSSNEECRSQAIYTTEVNFQTSPTQGFRKVFKEWGNFISAVAVNSSVSGFVDVTVRFSMPEGYGECVEQFNVLSQSGWLLPSAWIITSAVIPNNPLTDPPVCYIGGRNPDDWICPDDLSCYPDGDELIIVVPGQPGQPGADGADGVDGVCNAEDCMCDPPVLVAVSVSGVSNVSDFTWFLPNTGDKLWGVFLKTQTIPSWMGKIPGSPALFDLGVFTWRDYDASFEGEIVINQRSTVNYRSGQFPAGGFSFNLRPGILMSSATAYIEEAT